MNSCCAILFSFLLTTSVFQDRPTVIHFRPGKTRLDPEARTILDSIARVMKDNPAYKLVVAGDGREDLSGRRGALSWDRVNTAIHYLVKKKKLFSGRIIFRYNESVEENTIELREGTDEDSPTQVPAPPPHLRKSTI